MTKFQKGLAVLGIAVVLLGLGGTAVKAASFGGSFIDDIKKLVASEIVDRLFGSNANQSEASFGSTQTTALHATAETVSNVGGYFLWDTDSNSGLEVKGPTWLQSANVSSTLVVAGTSTLAVTAKQQYFLDFTFGSATTSPVNSQYTGPTVAVDGAWFDIDPAVAQATNSLWRAYLGTTSGDMNTRATTSLFRQTTLATSSLQISYGGPVESSYYTSSTINQLGNGRLSTSTPIMLYNNIWVMGTSSDPTYLTGRLRLLVHTF